MTNDPQENIDVNTDDELSDEVLGGVSGGAVIGIPVVADDPPGPTPYC